ncbi:hypothetical protein [Paenarthrobacter ilicis]|uniref:hypothetical protein n=1 Tax=Paenarthrobacter ilicis TaxID=43665 RepID=UPI003862FB5F
MTGKNVTTVDEIQEILHGSGFPAPVEAVTPSGAPALIWDPELDGEALWQVQRKLTGKLPGWHVFSYGVEPSDPEELAEAWEEQGPESDDLHPLLDPETEQQALHEFTVKNTTGEEPADGVRSSVVLPEDAPAYSTGVGNLIAVQVENPGDVVHAVEWEGADNLGSRTELAVLLRRWNRLAGAVPVHLSDTDNANLILAVPDLLTIQEELKQACDETTIIATNPSRTTLVELWWD